MYIFSVGCERDIVFVIDISNALTPEQYETNLILVTNVVERLYENGGQFAVVPVNDNPRVYINFIQDTIGIAQLQRAVIHVFYLIYNFLF